MNAQAQPQGEVKAMIPHLTGDILRNDLFNLFRLPEAQRRWEMDIIWLKIKARELAEVPAIYFVDFLQKAQLTGADPRLNQIYLIPQKRKIDGQWVQSANIVFAYQFLLIKATATGQLTRIERETVVEDYLDVVAWKPRPSLTSIVRVWRSDSQYPTTYRARFPEFAKTTSDGSLFATWKEKPYLMLEKCALANALRLAFPEVLTGVLAAEEVDGTESLHVLESVPLQAVESPKETPPQEPVRPTVARRTPVRRSKYSAVPTPPQEAIDLEREIANVFAGDGGKENEDDWGETPVYQFGKR